MLMHASCDISITKQSHLNFRTNYWAVGHSRYIFLLLYYSIISITVRRYTGNIRIWMQDFIWSLLPDAWCGPRVREVYMSTI